MAVMKVALALALALVWLKGPQKPKLPWAAQVDRWFQVAIFFGSGLARLFHATSGRLDYQPAYLCRVEDGVKPRFELHDLVPLCWGNIEGISKEQDG